MKHAVVAACLTAMLARNLGSQTPATFRGQVVADDGGEPIANARVTIASNVVGRPVVLTDGEGRFSLPVTAGPARLIASKPGFGRVEVDAAPQLVIRLARGAAVSGRITDETGEPVQNARVAARLASAGANDPFQLTTTTDDRGDYRLGGLAPGTYHVAAMPMGLATPERVADGFVVRPRVITVYFPDSAATEGAQAVRLAAGEDRPRVDFAVPGARTSSPIASLFQPGPLSRPPTPRNGERATSIVRGRVVTSDGRGVSRADLRLTSLADRRETLSTRADAEGRFEFRDLPAGRYLIGAGKVGYALSPPASPLTVGEDAVVDRVDIPLRRWSSIAGRIVDENGDPMQGAAVQALHVRYERGRRRLVPAGQSSLADDLGRYRLPDMPPGRYVVSASVSDVFSADLPGYARTFYPGSANAAQAQFVALGDAQEIGGIDLSMSRTRTARISGKIVDAAAQPTTGGNVVLLPAQSSASATFVGAGARIANDGQFEFPSVASGQYVIQVSRGRLNASTEGEFAAMPVTVDGVDVTGLMIQTSAGSSIQGRFTFDTRDRAKIPSRSAIELAPVPVDPDASPASFASADIQEDWRFEIRGVNGARRLLLLRAPNGWTLQEIRVNGVDATDRPIAFGRTDQSLRDVEVILTDRVSELAGRLGGAGGTALASARAIAFASDRARWYPASRYLRTAPIGADGTFSIAGLPFGSYYVAAVARLPDEGDDAWQDPEFLEPLIRQASAVTIREGEKTTVQVIAVRF